MFNLDLSFEEILEDIFVSNLTENEETVKLFCSEILKEP